MFASSPTMLERNLVVFLFKMPYTNFHPYVNLSKLLFVTFSFVKREGKGEDTTTVSEFHVEPRSFNKFL